MARKVKIRPNGKGGQIFIAGDELEYAGLKPGDYVWVVSEEGKICITKMEEKG